MSNPETPFGRFAARAFASLHYAAGGLYAACLLLSPPGDRATIAPLGFFLMVLLLFAVPAPLSRMLLLGALAFVLLAFFGSSPEPLRPEGFLEGAALFVGCALAGCALGYGLFSVRRLFAGGLAALGAAVMAGCGHLRRGTFMAAAKRRFFSTPFLVGLCVGACVGLYPEALIGGYGTAGAALACAPLLPFALYGRPGRSGLAGPVDFLLRAACYVLLAPLVRLAGAYLAPVIHHGFWLSLAYGIICYQPVLGPAMRRLANVQPAGESGRLPRKGPA